MMILAGRGGKKRKKGARDAEKGDEKKRKAQGETRKGYLRKERNSTERRPGRAITSATGVKKNRKS